MAENEARDIWALLEEAAPAGCEAVQNLYSWSLNYDAGTGPFPLFLDLIGWSEEEYGQALSTDSSRSRLGYLELTKLADALQEYGTNPHIVREYVGTLMAAEAQS